MSGATSKFHGSFTLSVLRPTLLRRLRWNAVVIVKCCQRLTSGLLRCDQVIPLRLTCQNYRDPGVDSEINALFDKCQRGGTPEKETHRTLWISSLFIPALTPSLVYVYTFQSVIWLNDYEYSTKQQKSNFTNFIIFLHIYIYIYRERKWQ